MDLSDEEYFKSIQNVFDVFPLLFTSDVAFGLTDTKKLVTCVQAKTFTMNIKEVLKALPKDGVSEQVMKSRAIIRHKYPKEVFGIPVTCIVIPVINKSTNNVLGTLIVNSSQEKEDNIIKMINNLKGFAEQLTASSQELASSAEELSANSHSVDELANKSSVGLNKMNDILRYITQVSNTTNMLGLNAAIEAARAGEHGKGFAVVAKEISNLAAQSKSSAVDIANSLKEIKKDIEDIMVFINTFASASEIQASQAEELTSSGEGINEATGKLQELIEDL